MYNGRQQHIQTESIQDQSLKKNPSMNTEMGKALLDMSRTKIPAMKNKTLGRKRNVQGAKQLLLITKREK